MTDTNAEEIRDALQKAEEALDRLLAMNDDYCPFGGYHMKDIDKGTWRKARTTLAELTGGKDD